MDSLVKKPMLANRIDEKNLDTLKGYICEPKFDGSRNLFIIDFEKKSLIIKRRNSRNNVFEQIDNYQFPEFTIRRLKKVLHKGIKNVVFDGEMICKDFATLMSRTHLTDTLKIKMASLINPAKYMVFDILYLNGNDLTHLPYLIRRNTLEKTIVEKNDYIQIVPMFDYTPSKMFNKFLKEGYEGIVLKRKESRYIQKRSDEWLKCKKHFTETLEIIGYDTKSNSRPQKNKSIKVPVLNVITNKGRITIPRKENQDYFYVHKPNFVEVEFQELSDNNKMRFPKFLRFVR